MACLLELTSLDWSDRCPCGDYVFLHTKYVHMNPEHCNYKRGKDPRETDPEGYFKALDAVIAIEMAKLEALKERAAKLKPVAWVVRKGQIVLKVG